MTRRRSGQAPPQEPASLELDWLVSQTRLEFGWREALKLVCGWHYTLTTLVPFARPAPSVIGRTARVSLDEHPPGWWHGQSRRHGEHRPEVTTEQEP